MRAQLSARGANTIRGLSRVFKSLDSNNGNRKVDAQEFYVGLKEIGLTISKQDIDVTSMLIIFSIQVLISHFDTDGDNSINFDEFLVGIRVSMHGMLTNFNSRDT